MTDNPPAAVIAAAGRGERTGSKLLKQFVLLEGRPVFRWSVDLMLKSGCDPVIVALPSDALDEARSHLSPSASIIFLKGGETRQESVARALEHVEREVVVVHDAARPLATEGMVRSVLDAVPSADAAITAVPVGDTLKRVRDDYVDATVPRGDLWLSQTPQAFTTEALKRAHNAAGEEGYVASDDAELIERYGGSVVVVAGSRMNLKITFADDFRLAEAYVRTK